MMGGIANSQIITHETVDADHGRIEARKYTVIHNVDWLQLVMIGPH